MKGIFERRVWVSTVGALLLASVCPTVRADVPSTDAGGGATTPTKSVETIASAQFDASKIVVDAKNVYWLAGAKIVAAPKSGGAPTVLAPQVDVNAEIASDGVNVYWTESIKDKIMSVPAAGGTPKVLASHQAGPGGIAVDARNVYWSNTNLGNDDRGEVARVSKAGGNVTLMVGDLTEPSILRIDDARVYWREGTDGVTNGDGSLYAAEKSAVWIPQGRGRPKPPSTAHQVTTGSIIDFAADAAGPVWIERGDGTVGGGELKVMALPRGKSKPVTLGTARGAKHIAIDASRVFVSTQDSILSLPRAGGASVAIVSGIDEPKGLAADGAAVYWTTKGVKTNVDGVRADAVKGIVCSEASGRKVCVEQLVREGWAYRDGTVSRLVL